MKIQRDEMTILYQKASVCCHTNVTLTVSVENPNSWVADTAEVKINITFIQYVDPHSTSMIVKFSNKLYNFIIVSCFSICNKNLKLKVFAFNYRSTLLFVKVKYRLIRKRIFFMQIWLSLPNFPKTNKFTLVPWKICFSTYTIGW